MKYGRSKTRYWSLACLFISVACLAALLVSLRWQYRCGFRPVYGVCFSKGMMFLPCSPVLPRSKSIFGLVYWSEHQIEGPYVWYPCAFTFEGRFGWIGVPLWIPCVAFAIAAAVFWRQSIRAAN